MSIEFYRSLIDPHETAFYLLSQALKEGTAEIEKQIKDNPKDPKGYIKKIALMQHNASPDQIENCFQNAVQQCGEDAMLWYAKAIALASYEGQEKESLRSFRRAIEINPGCFEAQIGLGTWLNRMGRHKEALKVWNKIIELDSEFPEGWFGRGRSYFWLGNYQKALKASNAAIFCLQEAKRRNELVLSLFTGESKGNIDKVMAGFLASRGATYQKMNQIQNAIEDFVAALKLDPSEQTLAKLCEIYISQNQPQKAIPYVKTYLRENPQAIVWQRVLRALMTLKSRNAGPIKFL